jgi:hypothetical protein
MGIVLAIGAAAAAGAVGYYLGGKKGLEKGKEEGFQASINRYKDMLAVSDGEGYARGRVIGWLRAWEAVRDERGVEEADTLLADAKAPPDISKYPFRMYASAEKGHRVMHDGKKFLITDEERADGKKRGL